MKTLKIFIALVFFAVSIAAQANLPVIKSNVELISIKIGEELREGDIDLSGLDITSDAFKEATSVNLAEWKKELQEQGSFFEQIGPTMPQTLNLERQLLLSSIDDLRH